MALHNANSLSIKGVLVEKYVIFFLSSIVFLCETLVSYETGMFPYCLSSYHVRLNEFAFSKPTDFLILKAETKKIASDTLSKFNSPEKSSSNQTFYLGSRYFFNHLIEDEHWGQLSPFVGSKGAYVWHERTSARENKLGSTFNKKQLSSSVGAHVGLDWSIDSNWGFVFTAEAAKKKTVNTLYDSNLDAKEVSEISFPVTVGFRFAF